MTDSPICLTDSPEIVQLKCEFGALDARDQELKAVAAKSLDAAILLLGRIETALVAHVAARRFTDLVVIDETRPVTTGHVHHGMIDPVLQLQAAA